jgi:phosphorylcholine metabolism protein LicD
MLLSNVRHLPVLRCEATPLNSTHSEFHRDGSSQSMFNKYFQESSFDVHYDGRFAEGRISSNRQRVQHLSVLLRTFVVTMKDIGVETWIMHGTLLGWWWNQQILPWDSDLDLQVSESGIAFLAKYYNMTEYRFTVPGMAVDQTYLMEINPHYKVRRIEDDMNVIDARWIDTQTGLFIDITAVRADYVSRARGVRGALFCKDKHRYQVSFSPPRQITLLC